MLQTTLQIFYAMLHVLDNLPCMRLEESLNDLTSHNILVGLASNNHARLLLPLPA